MRFISRMKSALLFGFVFLLIGCDSSTLPPPGESTPELKQKEQESRQKADQGERNQKD